MKSPLYLATYRRGKKDAIDSILFWAGIVGILVLLFGIFCASLFWMY